MIIIHCGAMQNELISLLEHAQSDIVFTYIEKSGIKLKFSVNTSDIQLAIDTAKAIIKESDLGKSLYFQVTR